MEEESVQSLGTQAKEAKGFHTHQSGPRTYADVKEFLQTDPTIRVMKSGIEGIFGGLWILLLVTVSFAFAEVVRVWVFGFKDEKEQRKLRYFADRKNRITITLFCIIVYVITVLLFLTAEGKRIISNGTVIFLFGATIYMVFFYKSKKPKVSFAGDEGDQTSSGRSQAGNSLSGRTYERAPERPAPETLDASQSPEDVLRFRNVPDKDSSRLSTSTEGKSKKRQKK